MTRLPTPGSDDGTWGNVLNDYLSVGHEADGTHKAIVNPDATTTAKGKLKLAGDLGGTADVPTVPGLVNKYTKPVAGIPKTDLDAAVQTSLGKADTAPTALSQLSDVNTTGVADTQVLTYNALASKWQPAAAGVAGLVTKDENVTLTSSTTSLNFAGTGVTATTSGNNVTVTVPGAPVTSVAGKTGVVTLVKGDVGLGNVDNTSDVSKPISTATQTALDAKAADSAVVHNTGAETIAGVKTFSASPIVPTPTTSTQAANKAYVDSLAGTPTALWVPSDATGATDMTTELEAFRAAHLGQTVKVFEGSTILLKNAFGTVTTGDILVDFTACTVLYDSNTQSDYAIKCDNTANASAEVSVSSLAIVTVNSDATVSRVTLGSTLSAKRFDWVALYSTDANPAIAGGFLGEIFQLITDEASLQLTATRKLNRHSSYATTVKARKLNASRRVYIKGGTFKANGNTEDHAITTRATGILVQGFVDPLVEDVTFDHPWSTGLRFQACAAPRWRNFVLRDVGNLANFNGYTYGVILYGMNDQADGRNTVVRNGRHAGFTTDGNSGSSATWYNKGIPTNALVTGTHGYNCHASVVDTHEEGDNIVIDGVYDFYPYQDEDIAPNFSGLGVQLRCGNPTLRNLFVFGGTRGIKVNAIDHGFEDQVTLENINIGNLTQTASVDGDSGVTIDDESALTNKRHIYFDGVMNNVGLCFVVGKTAKLTISKFVARRFDTIMDAGAGALVTFTGLAEFDYRNDPRTAPYQGILCRSTVANGGASVVFLQKPKIIKGTDNSPTTLLVESDTLATKKIYVPGLTEYNPSGVTATLVTSASATTFSAAAVTETPGNDVIGNPRPADQNLAGWAFDPACAGSNFSPTAGTVYMIKVMAAVSTTITKLYVGVSAATAVSATASQNFLGLYDTSRNLIVSTVAGAIDGSLGTLGSLTGTVASTAVVAGTSYYVAFLWNGSATAFSLARGSGTGIMNLGLAAASSRFAASSSAQTSLPATAAVFVANVSSTWGAFSA